MTKKTSNLDRLLYIKTIVEKLDAELQEALRQEQGIDDWELSEHEEELSATELKAM